MRTLYTILCIALIACVGGMICYAYGLGGVLLVVPVAMIYGLGVGAFWDSLGGRL